MKNVFKSVVAAIAIIFSGTIQSQTKSPKLENSLLWEISGNGLSKPSYLYGTLHMICSADYFLSEKTKKAFEASNKLVLEVNVTDPNEIKHAEKMAMGKQPLSKTLSPEEWARLDEILQKNAKVTAQQVDAFSMMTIIGLLSFKSFGCDDLKQYENVFVEMAAKKSIEVGGFETYKYQLDALDNAYSNSEMINMLEEATKEESTQLVADYKSENIESIYVTNTREKVMNAKAKKYMLDGRNTNWVKIMPEMMKKESVFFAVGSAHLAGDFGVINLLRKAGYKVKPVMN